MVARGFWRRGGGVATLLDMPVDEDEVRVRLLDAAGRAIVRRGDTEIRMADVAAEAGVVRSTVYRYYPTRDDLLLGLLLRRIDTAVGRWVRELRRPTDPAGSIRALVLNPVVSVGGGDPLNAALYASDSAALAPVLQAGAREVSDIMARHVAPLFRQWKDAGRIHSDLTLTETVQWITATTSFLLTTHWRDRSLTAKRRFVDRYLIRALVCS